MKVLFVSLMTLLSGALPASAMPDKIGNGAGVWVCENTNGDIFGVMFMDIFEAQREYRLNVPPRTENHDQLVQEKKAWLARFLPEGQKIVTHVEYVEKNITWIDDIINAIPDGAHKISPHPSTCRQGKWDPVQLVNFTDDFRVLVRRDLFNTPLMSEVERAAVYMHEGIYSYLRTEFNDTTSVRTRAIVGFLFSDLRDDEKVQRIQKVLAQTPKPPEPPPAPPAQGWMCGLKPDSFSPLYIFEAKTEAEARTGALDACVKGENPLPGFPGNGGGFPGGGEGGFPGFPGGAMAPGFPGFPGGIPGPGMNCKPTLLLCEQITSSAKTHQCVLAPLNRAPFTGYGRTLLEARHEVLAQCATSESPQSCYVSRDITCQ